MDHVTYSADPAAGIKEHYRLRYIGKDDRHMIAVTNAKALKCARTFISLVYQIFV